MKKRDKNIRSIHRDFGYFYLGLIISFAFSGILMNHRESWHPEKYTTELFEQKCGVLFQHVLEKYPDQGASVYAEAG